MNLVHNRKKKKKKKKKDRETKIRQPRWSGHSSPLPFPSMFIPYRVFRAPLFSQHAFDELLFFRKILLRFGVLEDHKFENLS